MEMITTEREMMRALRYERPISPNGQMDKTDSTIRTQNKDETFWIFYGEMKRARSMGGLGQAQARTQTTHVAM